MLVQNWHLRREPSLIAAAQEFVVLGGRTRGLSTCDTKGSAD
jgi:hypothetical protein